MADPSLYKITYANGTVKHGGRKILGAVVGYARTNRPAYCKGRVIKIERAPEPAWEDVTDEFLGEK